MKSALAVLFLLVGQTAFAATDAAPVAVVFGSENVEVRGVTPKANVYLYSLAREDDCHRLVP